MINTGMVATYIWQFIGAVASIQKAIESEFLFSWNNLNHPPRKVLYTHSFEYAIEQEYLYRPPINSCATDVDIETEMVQMKEFELVWNGFVYCGRFGYGERGGCFFYTDWSLIEPLV